MFPAAQKRIGWTGWRVILVDEDGIRRTVVVEAASKRSAGRKAAALWDRKCFIYDCSVVSGFDPAWFDVAWSD